MQAEAQFHLNRITSDASKYNLLLTALDYDTTAGVADIIRNRPTINKYDGLTSAILCHLMDSPDTQLHKLLTGLELGDESPSQLLRQMQTLADNRVGDNVLRVKWLDILPN